ncbi:MAG: 2-oxo acid dehydrogenase subunit E2 [Actinomycetota bacterium]|nr:2-oxo acid dehydrogenase subunit E2 [Actinomycetota bacterium]
MSTEFIMPKLGLTMEEGTILEWLVEDGTEITQGMAVLRIETDKVESDVESPGAGRFHRVGNQGDTYPCGALIGYLLADGEEPPGAQVNAPTAAATATSSAPVASSAPATSSVATLPRREGRLFASPNARRVAKELGIEIETVVGSGPEGRITSEDVEEALKNPNSPRVNTSSTPSIAVAPILSSNGNVLATAAARQLADLLGVDLSLVPYDATDGRVTKDGVAAFVRAQLASGLAANKQSPSTEKATVVLTPVSQTPTSIKKMSGMRGTIAKRMQSSLQDMAQLTLHMDADLDAVVEDRESRKSSSHASDSGNGMPGFTDYVIAATARALKLHPIVNSQVTAEGIALLPEIHVSMAVALPEGLIVPVIKNTTSLDLASLASETKRLSGAAREGKLGLAELEGGTFSVSTLGMFGVDGFTPVINPPNTAILGVGRLRDDVVVSKKGKVSTVKRMTLSLTWDHRVFDGAPAAEFCKSIVDLLADPSALNK